MSPFAGYEDMEACVADNQDRDDPEAYCAAIKEQVEALDEEHPKREAGGFAQPFRSLATGDDPGAVRRTEHDDGAVTYHNLLLIAPGEWTDAASGETIFYSPEAMHTLAEAPEEHVTDTSVNVDHAHQDQLKQVGDYDPDSLTTDDEGNVYADVTLHGRTQASEDAIGLMDLALETEGEQGAGGLSVEIPMDGERTEWDDERGMEKMVEFNLAGLAIVTDSASEPAAFDQQFAERAVAMASGDGADTRVLWPGETDLSGVRLAEDMDADELRDLLDEATVDDDDLLTEEDVRDIVNEELADEEPEDDPEEELQDGNTMDVAQDVIERARQEGFDLAESTAQELMQFIEENLDVSEEEQQALSDVADAYLQAEEAESLEATPAEGLLDFIEEQGGAEENGDGGEGGEEGEDMAADAEEVGELQEQNEELQATVDELERRLSELEDEPNEPRSLRENADVGGQDEQTATGEPVPTKGGGISRDGDYIGR